MVVLELGGRCGARAEEGTPAAALHPRVVVDEAQQADEEAAGEQEREPGEAAAVPLLERLLDRLDRLGEDVPEQEDEDSGRGRGEERLRPGLTFCIRPSGRPRKI